MKSDPEKSMINMSAEEHLNIIIGLSEEIFHDFKNSLATISGISQMTTLYPASKEVKENLKRIQEATFECRDQIDRFYSFIKGHNEDKAQYEILSNIVFSALDMIKHRINKIDNSNEGIVLSVNIHSMNKVLCNEYKLRQAILNILINAVDAMEETGGILEVNLYEQSDMIVLEIIDTGIGIPQDKFEKIFEANYTTKGHKGTGLGLKISKTIVEEYDGRLELSSKLGKGTIFTMVLPREKS